MHALTKGFSLEPSFARSRYRRSPGGVSASQPPVYAPIVVLRCTQKLLALVGERDARAVELPPGDDDWYLHLLWVDRRKCLLAVHAGTLFAALAPAIQVNELRPLAPFVARLIEHELRSEDLPADILGPLDPANAQVTRTASRSVLGFANRIAFECRYLIDRAGGLESADIDGLNRWLRRTLHSRGGYTTPLDLIGHRLGSG